MQIKRSETHAEYGDFSSLRLGFEKRALRQLTYPGLAKEVFYWALLSIYLEAIAAVV